MKSAVKLLNLFIVIVTIYFVPAQAEAEHKHHKAHEHDHAKLELVMINSEIKASLELPALNVLGFEHKAKTDGEKALIKKAIETLKSKDAWIVAKGCTSIRNTAEHETDDEHAEFEVKTTLKCSEKVPEVELVLFKTLSSLSGAQALKEIEYEYVGPSGQKSGVLTLSNPKLAL